MCCAEAGGIRPPRLAAGLDLGSRAVKLCLAGPEGVVQTRVLEAVPFLLASRRAGEIDRGALELPAGASLVTTGYGRAALAGGRGISEIRAHFQGAKAQTGLADFTLVELGGQDSKVLQVEGGRVLDFATNDRCAAGTGRYLENMARLLGVGLAELARAREDPVEISNTCATFGETEILARLLEGAPLGSILAGVNLSVARRVAQMVRRHRPRRLVFCGGVALNAAVVEFVEKCVGCPVVVPPEPQLNGAIGCCMETGVEHG
jgi:predicted CoA-substrate-specific enzyme activase